ncbi:restriction endonuclease subunit S [Myroides sp. C8-3]|uniref:restriction endonuclease subunit S n=1 Tax=Myroides sp. C8-3 TaxID=3400533 RepID=UPI003D2F8FF8
MERVVKFKDFLKRSKIPIELKDNETYKRVTIRIKHNGVSLRDTEIGKKIGTKKQFILKEGQFIVSKIDARYGAFGIASNEVDNAIITGNFWAYDVDFNIIDIDWFNQFTNSQYFYDLCEKASSGITHRKYLSEDSFLNNEINLPSLEEQKQSIANINNLKESGNSISTEITHQLDLIKNLRQAFLREAMQGTLVSNETTDGKTGADLLAEIQTEKTKLIKEKKIKKGKPLVPIAEEEIPFDIPENWTWCRLESINSKIGSGSTPKGGNYSQEGYPFFRSQNIQNDCLVFDDIKYINDDVQLKMKGTKVISNDLLLNITGGSLGRCALVPKEFKEGNVSQHVCILRSVLVLPKFYHQLIISPFIQQLIFSSTTGAGREGLPKYNLEQFVIPLPPLEVQERIVTKLDELMNYCDKLETQVKESQKTNELLLQQVLREALEGKPQEESIEKEVRDYQTIVDSVFGTSNKVQSINNSDLEDAALVYLMKNNLGYSYGEVALQKAKYNSSFITPNLYSKQYDFRNYHFGTYSEELRGDLQNNPYLIQKKENGKEIFAINPSKEKEILDIISNKENKDFVTAINELLQIYSLPFIGKKTDMMELFNTVLKIYADLRKTNIDIIYQAMKDWKVKQTGFKTKAEKFSKEDTEKMIKLLQSKNIIK